MVNALIIFQEENGFTGILHLDLLWNFSIYIGDSTDYQSNELCPGSPFLPDKNNLSNSDKALEVWCNLEGKYVSIIRDYSSFFTPGVTICDLAIFGTELPDYNEYQLTRQAEIGKELIIELPHADYIMDDVTEIEISLKSETIPADIQI